MNYSNPFKIAALRTYLMVLLCGLFMFPAILKAGDSLNYDSQNNDAFFTTTMSSAFTPQHYLPQGVFETNSTQTKKKQRWFEGIRYSGNARFVSFYRNMSVYYDTPAEYLGGLTMPVNLTAGDGTQQPLLLLALEGNPSVSSRFKFELNFDHLLLRATNRTNQAGRLANLFVIFQFQAGVDTRIGSFDLTAGGGVNWYRMSQSTFWGYQYRDDLFERYPWEPEGHDFDRYNSFYYQGDIPRDARFGMQPTQGFILESKGLPGGFDAAFVYGKNTQTGGFQSYTYRDPQKMFASRLGRAIKNHEVGFNYFEQSGNTKNKVNYLEVVEGVDTFYVDDNWTSTMVTTADARLKFKKLSVYTEIGVGSYLSNNYNEGLKENAKPGVKNISRYKRSWDETLFLEVSTTKNLTLIPLKANAYRIGANVVNNSSSVFNTSIEEAKSSPDVPDVNNLNYYDGFVTEVGQLTNNRQGVNLSSSFEKKKLHGKFGLSFAQELNNLAGDTRNGARAGAGVDSLTKVPFTNSITYHQRLNGVTRSRFTFYRRFSGPYNRIATNFRRTFENIAITDTVIDYKKSFSNFELLLKFKTKLFGKEVIVSNFVDFSSVQEKWSPIPVFTDKAFFRYFYEELMVFYAIQPKLTLVGFVGMEKAMGNSRTELADADGNLIVNEDGRPMADVNGEPIDQRCYGYGLGIDYNFDARASLHMRNRWYTHQDKNFTLDEFKGYEMTVELKKFF